MKKIYLTTLLLNFSLLLAAQIQLGGAILFADFAEMNEDLSANSYPTIDDDVRTFSIMSADQKEDSDWVNRFGFLFNNYEYDDPASSTLPSNLMNDVNLRSLGFLFGSGYNFYRSKNLSFGPAVDVLLIQNKLRLLQNLPTNLSFGNVIANESSTQEFRNIKVMFQGNFNLLYHFNHKENKTEYGIGLTGGYRWDPFDPDWRFQQTDVRIDIEGSQQSGFFIGLMLSIKGPDFMPQKPNSRKERS